MATWETPGKPGARNFRENLAADPEVAGLMPAAELDAATDPKRHLVALDHLFTRAFGEAGPVLAATA